MRAVGFRTGGGSTAGTLLQTVPSIKVRQADSAAVKDAYES